MASTSSTITMVSSLPLPVPLPRVTIRFCTQCKWMLRAAYFAQELLSTFSTSLGEVALQPATGGIFVVEIAYVAAEQSSSLTSSDVQTSPAQPSAAAGQAGVMVQHRVLWDRKTDGGFPETKELKRRVRDVIEPERNLGHVDREYPSRGGGGGVAGVGGGGNGDKKKEEEKSEEQPSEEELQGIAIAEAAMKAAAGVTAKKDCEDCQ